uniref:Phosphodiesterase 4D interacting protein n=1 Tax=Lepisosteus oculatus TaxID=7918 RepID=W5M1I5_LEPOC
PVMSNGYRTLSQHLNDLKKENFSLKLRIYFLEERIQQKYEDSSEDVYRRNIELKVEVESLKQELQEKQQLLDTALTTAESLTNQNEAELQRRCEERQQEIDHMQEILETKIQLLQEEAKLARNEAEKMASHAEAETLRCFTLEKRLKESSEGSASLTSLRHQQALAEKDRIIDELTQELRCKVAAITELSDEKTLLSEKVEALEDQVHDLTSSLQQKERDAEFFQDELGREKLRIQQEMQNLIEEQQSQLNQYECAAGQCVTELQKAQLQVQSLQIKIHDTEATNKKLQEKLREMESELRAIKQAAQKQERTIQGLSETVTSKDTEAEELYRVIEGQNDTLCKLRDMAHRNQLQQVQVSQEELGPAQLPPLQAELLNLQNSLFSTQLELQSSQRAHRHSERRASDLARSRDRLQSDLQEALQHREATEQHNQELRSALQQARTELQARDRLLKEKEAEKQMEIEAREKTIQQLQVSLQEKEQLIQEYVEHLDYQQDSGESRDALLDKLRERIKDRDRALERAIDEKFRCLEEKESEVRRLQLTLREKERDLERLRCILSNNEETITSLDGMLRVKALELEQVSLSGKNLQWLKQEAEDKHSQSLRERDAIISQLQTSLHSRTKEAEELTAALLDRVSVGGSQLAEELRLRLQLKERLLQEALADRGRQASEHDREVQELLDTVSTRDQQNRETVGQLSRVIGERAAELQELRRQLHAREREVSELAREREQHGGGPRNEIGRLKSLLQEKDAFIEVLAGRGEDASGLQMDMQAMQDDLQLVLRKEQEAQQELSSLQSVLTKQREEKAQDKVSIDHQDVLGQLVLEYKKLNEALKAEKELYHSLAQLHTHGDSSEKSQALQGELDTIQALRGQLEEALARTRDGALRLERAAMTQPDFGEVSAEEDEDDDDEDGSSEFTDSIEEDENSKLTALTMATKEHAYVISSDLSCITRFVEFLKAWPADAGELGKCDDVAALQQHIQDLRAQLRRSEKLIRNLQRRARSFSTTSDYASSLERPRKGEAGWLTEGVGRKKEAGVKLRREERQIPEEEAACGPEPPGPVAGEGELGLAQGKRCAPAMHYREGQGKRRCTRPQSLDLGALLSQDTDSASSSQPTQLSPGHFWEHVEVSLREQSEKLRSDLALSLQDNRELQERLMVSEATVQAQAEQLKEYRVLLCKFCVYCCSSLDSLSLKMFMYTSCLKCVVLQYKNVPFSNHLCYRIGCNITFAGSCSAIRTEIRMETPSCSMLPCVLKWQCPLTDSPVCVCGSLAETSVEQDSKQVQVDLLPAPRPNKELQELVARVASLEAQLKSSRMEGKASSEDLKSATWPGKYDSLIQAQARELSHLRQKMRVGRGVCHILSQHLGDTTKSFEELLRANDIDYYMGQSFREQLAQSLALAERVNSNLSDRDRPEVDDKTGHELLALRLSKELQQKDKIIDSLRSKLQQRSDTPSSSHALSETTDQSDRTSFVSDDHASTNEELELCSDMDAASEYTQEEATGRGSPGQAITDPHSHSGTPPQHPSVQSSTTASHGAQSSNNNPIIPCTQHKPMDLNQAQTGLYSSPLSSAAPFPQPHYCPDPSGPPGSLPFDPQPLILGPSYHGGAPFSLAEVHQELQMLQRQLGEKENRGYAVPHIKPMASFPLASHSQPESSSFAPLTRHAFHQSLLGCPANANGALKTQAGLLDAGAMWDMSHLARPGRASNYGDVSSGSSGYQSGTGHTGADLIEEHLGEIRSLQQRLEDSICTNNRLRQQLEERLATAGRDSGPPTNIYIQGLESVSQLSNENRALREENLGLQARLNQASRESSAEMEELREAVLAGRARLKEAELEAEQWREESRQLQAQSCEQQQEIQQLRQEKQASQERNNGLQHEVNLQQQQLDDSRQLLHSLQCELQVYDRVCRAGQSPHSAYRGGAATALELNELLAEVRGLRVQLEHSIQENSCLREQLEQQLGRSLATHRAPRPSSISITTPRDTGCKRQLFQDPVPSPPVRDTGMFNPGSPFTLFSKSTDLDDPDVTGIDILQPNTVLEGEAPDGSFANKNGRHAIGHVDDFSALQQQILEGKMLVHKMEAVLQSSLSAAVNTGQQPHLPQSLDCSSVKTLLSNTKTLRQILDEAASLLKMFWRAALPSGESCAQHIKKEQSMTEEIQKLQRKITEQEGLLQSTIERLKNTNRTKESMEHFIVSQLSRTRDVLKKARTNLEKNEYQISSLSSYSPCAGKAAIPRCPREPSSDWGFLSSRKQEPARKRTSHRPTKTRNAQCLLQVVTY